MTLYTQLQERLQGHPYNGYFACACVFHDDHNPSMFVYEDSQRYSCKSCGARGTLEHLARKLNTGYRVATTSAPVVLPRWREWERKWGNLQGIAEHAHKSIKNFPAWGFYFRDRGIFQYYEQGMFGFADNWALFPVLDANRKVQNIVVRHTQNKGRYAIKSVEDKSPLLYCPNWHRVNSSDVVYVPFGIVDAWAFESVGLACVTGITGKALDPSLLAGLNKKIVLIPDMWEEKEAHRIANQIGWRAKVKSVIYPDDCKDPDNVRRIFGDSYFMNWIGAQA
jgi:hypothetical protein